MANIVDTAVRAGSFTTLLSAVKAAGLTETLSGPGPFTVFAPSDNAFAKLTTGAIDSLLKDIPKLTSILKYHVVSGEYTSADIGRMRILRTVQGRDLSISTAGDEVKVDGARVVNADVETENGVIPVIDTVLMPKA